MFYTINTHFRVIKIKVISPTSINDEMTIQRKWFYRTHKTKDNIIQQKVVLVAKQHARTNIVSESCDKKEIIRTMMTREMLLNIAVIHLNGCVIMCFYSVYFCMCGLTIPHREYIFSVLFLFFFLNK